MSLSRALFSLLVLGLLSFSALALYPLLHQQGLPAGLHQRMSSLLAH